jgi:DNA-binding MurR/RpiR family transcriptional regulator
MKDLKSKIQINYLSFTKKEKLIADYLLDHAQEAKNMTISELATACGVAESTIFLFSKKLKLSGFKELTVLLANDHNKLLLDSVDGNEDTQALVKKVFDSNIRALEDTAQLIDYENLTNAVQLLTNSNKIVFFALGGSTPIALDAYHKFLRTPLDVEFNLEYHMQLLKAGKLNENSCAFIISHSGKNPDILRLVELLKKNKVPIISITSFDNTPLVKKSDVVFLTPTEELDFKNAGIYTRRVSQLVLIDILFTLTISSDPEKTISHLEQFRHALPYTK